MRSALTVDWIHSRQRGRKFGVGEHALRGTRTAETLSGLVAVEDKHQEKDISVNGCHRSSTRFAYLFIRASFFAPLTQIYSCFTINKLEYYCIPQSV